LIQYLKLHELLILIITIIIVSYMKLNKRIKNFPTS